jgi:NAD(P)H-hydrate epimerase
MKRLTSIPPMPARPVQGHKGTFGKLLVLAGSEGMVGAGLFCSLAALRLGCGLVYLATPRAALPIVLSHAPEIVGLPLPAADKTFTRMLASASALAAGPGIGISAQSMTRLRRLLASGVPCVVDADGLTLLAQGKIKAPQIKSPLVLTPHPGEMAKLSRWLRLGEVSDDEHARVELAGEAARRLGQVVVLKGYRTVITDGQRYRINESGDTSLAKAGTGDVLTGMVASLLAQGMPPFDAASLAVHLHGVAGETAGRRLGPRSVLARDVIDSLHAAIMMHHPS